MDEHQVSFVVEMMDPTEILDNPANYRRHPVKQLSAIRQSLKKFGWVESTLFNKRTGHLINGHARVYIARTDKLGPIPVHVVDVSEEVERQMLLTLQKTNDMALIDEGSLERLLQAVVDESDELPVGWDAHEIEALLKADEEDDPTQLAPTPADAKLKAAGLATTRMVQLFLTQENKETWDEMVSALGETYGTDTITDTVYQAVMSEFEFQKNPNDETIADASR